MKIFLDFDDTLFNTKDFIRDFSDIFSSQGISRETYQATRKKAYRSFDSTTDVYDVDLHIDILKRQFSHFDTLQAKRSVDAFMQDTSAYVFPDVVPFLEEMKQQGNECYVLSFGQADFQMQKIQGTGLGAYFQGVMIVQDKKHVAIRSHMTHPHEPVWFFEDRADYIDDVKDFLPSVVVVQVSRLFGRYHDTQSENADYMIGSLYDILPIFEK